MGRLIERVKPVWGSEPKNYTGAASTSDIVSFKNYKRATVIIQTGAWAGGTAAVTLKQAQDVTGTGVKALSFDKVFTNDGAPASDTLTETTVSDTFNLDTANSLYVIEVKADDLDINSGFDCMRVDVASPGVNADVYGVTIIMHQPRYAQANPPSAITD